MIEALVTALGTAAGKAVVGLTVASASIGGLAAADVVELPDLSDKPAEVTTDDDAETPDLPAEADFGQDTADAAVDKHQDSETTEELEVEPEVAETDAGVPNENATFGQDVAVIAQTEGTTGEDVSTYARENNPGVDARQDGEVRQDDGADEGADAAEQDPPADQAGENPAPEAEMEPGDQADTAGSQAEGRNPQG